MPVVHLGCIQTPCLMRWPNPSCLPLLSSMDPTIPLRIPMSHSWALSLQSGYPTMEKRTRLLSTNTGTSKWYQQNLSVR